MAGVSVLTKGGRFSSSPRGPFYRTAPRSEQSETPKRKTKWHTPTCSAFYWSQRSVVANMEEVREGSEHQEVRAIRDFLETCYHRQLKTARGGVWRHGCGYSTPVWRDAV